MKVNYDYLTLNKIDLMFVAFVLHIKQEKQFQSTGEQWSGISAGQKGCSPGYYSRQIQVFPVLPYHSNSKWESAIAGKF